MISRRISAVLLAAAGLAGCGRGPRLRSPNAPVVLVSIDTLRADHLPAYGYKDVETPALDALRADSILFRNAYSQVPLTLPSHTSLMTGLLPAETGVRDNLGFRKSPKIATLASILKKRGYATGAAISTIVLTGESGMKDGFDLYDASIETTAPGMGLGRVQRAGGESAAILDRWIAGLPSTPFFAFLHLYEPHTPYEPPEPFRSRYAKSPYDGEIATADDIVGRFLASLKERGLYDRALVILLSDHGEGLGEHGEDEHGVFLYRETLHVPLMVKLPKSARAGTAVDDPVGLIDVLPTVLDVVRGGEAPPGARGLPLTRFLARDRPPVRRIFSETAFPRLHYGWSDLASLVDDRWHYIEAPRAEIYDLAADPRELRDLAAGLPGPFRAMKLEATRLRVARVEAPEAVDAEQAAKLASLGYIGSTAAPADAVNLPDPKEKAGSVRELKRAFGLLADGRTDEAIGSFRALLRAEPKMLDGWNGLAETYRRAGRTEEALAALKESARLSPGATELLLSIGSLALELGKTAEARAHAELALAGGSVFARELLASVAIAEKDYATALKETAEAERQNPERRLPRILEARALTKAGRVEDALRVIEDVGRSSADKKPIMTMHQTRADVLARLGREGEAEAEFQEELRLFPENAEAYQDLALLYASQGSAPKLYAALDRLLKARPGRPGRLAAAHVLDVVGDRAGATALRKEPVAERPGHT
jgi:arylsulfatase A-like enzyme/Flp pilus assembly protein TadD